MAKKEELKLFIWWQVEMSKQGYAHFNPKIRHKIKRVVFKPMLRIDVPVAQIRNKELLGKMIIDNIGKPGIFIVRAFSRGKTKTRVKQVRLAKVILRESRDGLQANVIETHRIARYWFWEGG